MNARRLIAYLLLNAVVSAAVTFSVLWLWDRAHPRAAVPVANLDASPTAMVGPAAPTAAATAVLEATTLGPTPTLYTVRGGDTLGTIAQKFDISVEDIMAANGITDPNVLSVGQSLVIPLPGFVPPTATAGAQSLLPTTAVEPPRATATRDPSVPLPRVTVREVRSAGDLGDEMLVLVNEGGPVDLVGWSLRDETGHMYIFPSLMLFQDGAINVHTAAGTDTVTDLYWGQSQAVWAKGTTVLLSDAAGNLHTRYSVP